MFFISFGISFGISLLVVLVIYYDARKGRGLGSALLVSAIAAFLGLAILPTLLLVAVLTAVIAVVCSMCGWQPGRFLTLSLGAVALSHVPGCVITFTEIRDREAIREKYPFKSLEERLGYENSRDKTALQEQAQTTPAGIARGRAALKMLEEEIDEIGAFRSRGLRQLHDSVVADFLEAPGFGFVRMVPLQAKYLVYPEADPIPLPPPDTEPMPTATRQEASPGEKPLDMPDPDALRKMHRGGVVDFVNPKGFGYVKDRAHVRGFQSHQFRTLPALLEPAPRPQRWRLQNLELVSLLKHDEPVAYLSRHLPRMDQLRDAPTRPLEPFEQAALDDLRRGEDLRAEVINGRLRMLGALRAVRACLSCHDVERGDLLGAFSYTLRRELPVP